MTEETKKTRGPRRSHAEIAADYEAKAKAAAQKAKLANTKGLKSLLAVRDALVTVCTETSGGAHAHEATGLLARTNDLIGEMSK